MLANSTIWKVNRTNCKDCGVGKFNDLEGQSTKQSLVKTAVLANSTIWKVNRTKQSCKDCGVGKFNNVEGQANCKDCGVGKFNDLEGQSDEAVACKTAVLANSTIWKVNRTKQCL